MHEKKPTIICLIFTILIIYSISGFGQAAIFAQRDIPVAFNLIKLNLNSTYDSKKGMYISKIGSELRQMNIFLGELEPGSDSVITQHIYEEMIYVLEGKGHTHLWKDDNSNPIRLDWEKGDLLSPPLNFRYKHYNDSGVRVKLLYVTTKPLVEVFFNNDFISNVNYSFDSIWDEYSTINTPKLVDNKTDEYIEMKAGFIVEDINNIELPEIYEGHNSIAFLPKRSAGMAGNRMLEVVISEYNANDDLPYKRHPWEIVFFVLDGNGGVILHMPGGPPDRLEFEEGELFYTSSNKWNWLGSLEGSKFRIMQIRPTAYFRNAWDVTPVINKKPAEFNEFFR